MGLLVEGKALSPDEIKEKAEYIRDHGIEQFLNIWKNLKDVDNDEFKYGDELECAILIIDDENKTVKLSVRGAEIKDYLNYMEKEHSYDKDGCSWVPEYGAWMIESTPSRPYLGYSSDLLNIEKNMIKRRCRLLLALNENEIAPYFTSFPLLGVNDYIHNPQPFNAPASKSFYIPDYIINPHPRFAALTRNIRKRRGKKVNIQVPMYIDKNTLKYYEENLAKVVKHDNIDSDSYSPCSSPTQSSISSPPSTPSSPSVTNPTIEMDAMAFGMGMCCLQVTFQSKNMAESRFLYDQLTVLAPIFLSITAATPIFRGYLSDIDVRWTVISQAVDDRTDEEKCEKNKQTDDEYDESSSLKKKVNYIPKSRYDSVSTFLNYDENNFNQKYNDLYLPKNNKYRKYLLETYKDMDVNLVNHLTHLFIRDPISAFHGQIELDDNESSDHFESLQSTNWQSCRWKPPPVSSIKYLQEHPDKIKDSDKSDKYIGWRFEFRTMEIQFTDFENAAFTALIVLITRVILAFQLNLYIPLSKVDSNMKTAHKRNSILDEKFYFRKNVFGPTTPSDSPYSTVSSTDSSTDSSTSSEISNNNLLDEDAYEEMSIDEIFNGKDNYYPGLIPLVHSYIDQLNLDQETNERLRLYLDFISQRASGKLISPATYIRQFVKSHPDYKEDSVISPSIAYDLAKRVDEIGQGINLPKEVYGNYQPLIFPHGAINKNNGYSHNISLDPLDSYSRNTIINNILKK